MRSGIYTHVRYEDGPTGKVEETITRHTWDAELIATCALDGSKVAVRPATEAEIEHFINSGAQDEEDYNDAEFERGWNEHKERDLF